MHGSASFEALLLDYEMGREDERIHSNLTVALVGVIAGLLAGIAAIITGDKHFRVDDGYDLPDLVSAFIPLLPLAIGGLLVMQGISATLRGLYLRQLEAALRYTAGTQLPDHRDLLAPSAHELNQAIISPIRGRPGYRALLALVLVTNFVAYSGVIYLAAQTVDTHWMRIAMYLGYGAGQVFFLYQVLGATSGGRKVLRRTADAIHSHLHYPYSLEPRSKGSPVKRTGRSLWSYLLFPRPGELVKWLFVPACYAIGTTTILDVQPPLPSTSTFLVAWLVFEYTTYQARYQWNDVRGFAADRTHRFASARARLPVARGPHGEVRAVFWSLVVLVLRIAASVAVVLTDPFGTGPFVLLASAAAWALAIVYELLRSGRSDGAVRSTAIVVVAGGGYAVRAILGFSLAAGGQLTWAPAVLLSVSAWAFGVMFVAMTWLLDAYASTRIEPGSGISRPVYFPQTATGRSLLSKPHFLLLLRSIGHPVPCQGRPLEQLNGESEHPMRGARDPRLPWNIALVLAATTGIAGLLTLMPLPSKVSAPSILITLGASLLVCAAPTPYRGALPLALGGLLLWFPFSMQGWTTGVAGLGLWVVVVGLYLAFRSSSYADLTVAPIRSTIAVIDGAGSLLLGSSWELLRPRRLALIDRTPSTTAALEHDAPGAP